MVYGMMAREAEVAEVVGEAGGEESLTSLIMGNYLDDINAKFAWANCQAFVVASGKILFRDRL